MKTSSCLFPDSSKNRELVGGCEAQRANRTFASNALDSHASCLLPHTQDPHQPPVPSDDVDAAQWFPVSQLRGLKGARLLCGGRLVKGLGVWLSIKASRLLQPFARTHAAVRPSRHAGVHPTYTPALRSMPCPDLCCCCPLQTWWCTATKWRSERCSSTPCSREPQLGGSRAHACGCCGKCIDDATISCNYVCLGGQPQGHSSRGPCLGSASRRRSNMHLPAQRAACSCLAGTWSLSISDRAYSPRCCSAHFTRAHWLQRSDGRATTGSGGGAPPGDSSRLPAAGRQRRPRSRFD